MFLPRTVKPLARTGGRPIWICGPVPGRTLRYICGASKGVEVHVRLGRHVRAFRIWALQQLRPKVVAAAVLIAVLAGVLLWDARNVERFGENLALNLGADLFGAIVVIFVITPLITRGLNGRVREHLRLDYDWFTDQVFHATSDVRILDTFSGLLDRPGTTRFLRALQQAMSRHAAVRILILDPDSLAAAQRTSELGSETSLLDVRTEILRNVRVLSQFQAGLSERSRQRFEVRFYSASASVTMYRWDDRALVSFLPIGRLSGDGTQLEVQVASPLGTFVSERFTELWRHGVPMTDFMAITLVLRDTSGERHVGCEYVRADGHYYVMDSYVLAHLAGARDDEVRANLAHDLSAQYTLELVPGESSLHADLVTHYRAKYDRSGHSFVLLRPEQPAEGASYRRGSGR